ncbi:hypothetical protein, partial [Levilactobacillus spicheri]|uniref:hypothetical protein n=1 Tax=Levilactobacillus spicheri TaxID=216463 RepID=UPI000AE27316
DYPDWYEEALQELQRQHDGPESRTFRYQDLQLKTSWWRMMDACGFTQAVRWLSKMISKFLEVKK